MQPGNTQGFNRYAYAQNNPLTFIDPNLIMSIRGMRCLARCFQVASLVCGWGLVLFALPASAAGESAKQCDETDASKFESPDGTWIARSYGEVCDLGLSTSAAVVLELVHAGNARLRQVIFTMTMPPTKSAWPTLSWESPKKVLIKVSSSAEVGLQVAYFQGVEVEVRFCPANRARWLEYRASYRKWIADTTAWNEMKKRDPNSAVPKPARPVPPGPSVDPACSQ